MIKVWSIERKYFIGVEVGSRPLRVDTVVISNFRDERPSDDNRQNLDLFLYPSSYCYIINIEETISTQSTIKSHVQ